MSLIKHSVRSALLAVHLLGAAGMLATPALAADKAGSAANAVAADQALTAFAKDWMVAALSRDGKFIRAHSIDAPAGSFSVFGTSGEKGYTFGPFVEHLTELKPFSWSELNPEGYVAGDFAWFSGTAKAPMPTGDVAKARLTLVMRRVDGAWKVVHCHLSEPVARTGIKKGS